MARAFAWLSSVVALSSVTSLAAAELDTVIVHGTRIGTSLETTATNGALGDKKLLDTPYAVTVVDADEISRRQVNSVAQLFINDPSISSASPAATTAWWGAQMRGMPVRNYYIDRIPLLLFYGGEFPLESVERVVALKGLAGFMFGFGTPGGALSYELKRPTHETVLNTALEYRNDSAFSVHVDAGGRLDDGDGAGYRINVAGEFGEAYTSADFDRKVGSVAFDYALSDNVKWFMSALHEDSTLKHEPLYFYFDSYPAHTALPAATYNYENLTVANSYYKTATTLGSTGLEWRIDDSWRASLTAGWSRKKHLANKMFAYLLDEAGNYEGYAYNFAALMENQFAQAIVQGDFATGVVRHEVVAGTSAERATTRWSEFYFSPDFTGNLYEPQTFRVTRDIDFTLAPVSEDQRQQSLFASDTVHVGEHWQAIVGLRYTQFESRDLDGDPTVASGYQTNELSPTYAVIFKPFAPMSIYASYVEALEPGSRVDAPYANLGEVLDATVSKQYEIGLKYEQTRTTLTAAVFRVERAAEIDEERDGARYLVQDGLTLYDGIEAMGHFSITPNLAVGLGATYLDARIDRVSEDHAELLGKRPASAAKWQAVASVDARVPQVAGLSAYANVRYFGDAYYEDQNLVRVSDRVLANAGIQYEMPGLGRRTVLTASINNLFNKKYWEVNTLGEARNGSLAVQVYW